HSTLFMKPGNLYKYRVCLILGFLSVLYCFLSGWTNITAETGENVILPCRTPNNQPAEVVEWRRNDMGEVKDVALYRDGRFDLDGQDPLYRNRVDLQDREMKNGDVSLIVKNVTTDHTGTYVCLVYQRGNKRRKRSYIKAGLDESSNGVMLDCSSSGWFPEPEVLWMDEEEIIISAGPTEKIEGPDGLYTISSRMVSLLLGQTARLMREEEEYMAKKKSDLEEELRKRNQDQRIIDQQIEALMKMSEELKEQKERLTYQRQEAVKIVEENDRKLKAIDDEVTNQSKNQMEKKAQGYVKLKKIITESNKRLTERKKDHQHVELMTQKLMEQTSQEVKKLKEIKQEIQNHVVEIEKQLKEMETKM
uniref:Ig-like domain-containing protein n=1 Tax=Cyprinodon variegatus TaxID=28743 RepID=A0A3Q2CH74_CYPVA